MPRAAVSGTLKEQMELEDFQKELQADLARRFQAVAELVTKVAHGLAQQMNQRFDMVERRLDRVENRLTAIEMEMNGVNRYPPVGPATSH